MPNTPGYARLRTGRTSEINRPYHIIISTQPGQHIFSDFHAARLMTQCLKQSDHSQFTQMLAYVIMPNHIHWLLVLKSKNISTCVQRVKAQFSREWGVKIWNAGFYDHGIRDEESLQSVARYIVANPLRAGLVQRVGDYPHWDAMWL